MSLCPFCSRENDSHASTDGVDDKPEAGNLSICWGCRKVAIFEDDGETTRRPTPEEQADIDQAPEVQSAIRVMEKSLGPSAAADIMRHASAWEASELQRKTGGI